nr:hypothetical protein [Acidisarcina polymorpha]
MPSQGHDGSIARLRLGKLGNSMVAAVMKAEALKPSRGSQLAPGRAPALLAALRVDIATLTGREEEVVRLSAAERFSALPELKNSTVCVLVHRDRPQPRIGLATPDSEPTPGPVYIPPAQIFDLDAPHGSA